ncbi:hypothetical protein TH66_03210 [Carbonactinospora thermoautotrophica]|uniref:Transcriptional regulator n=1 Tax=Carbonactinospora thermoautotrophica TaxID=1469144 RepID=A0A132NEM9_9ACTN|nr:hypothetical protein TH66_03210 [Carbonactinospora thermoautotrophica]KWX08571.1 hypothetical protein TR74_14395 [Carbonactinospora thermoautotrophica]
MERRTLLTGTAGLALAASFTQPPAGISPRSVGAADVRVIRSMLTSLSDSDHQFGGGHAREYATDYLRRVVVPRLHAHSEERVRRELFGVATQFALRVGWMHLDVGQAREARQYLGLAFTLAEEVGDPVLSAWVLAMRGLQEIWLNNVAHALAYTEGAVGMAHKAPPAARAFILGKNALAVSMTGARDDTLRLLGAVRDIYDTAGAVEEPAWTGIYGWGYVRDEEGHCYRNIGLGLQAVRAAEDALRLRGPDGYARIRAFSTGIRAIGYAQAGELEAACAAGHELVKWAGELASRRVNVRLAEVFTHLSPYQDDPRVKDLREAARPVLPSALPAAN